MATIDATLEGQVVHKRKKNRKMCFYDILETGTQQRKCLILKSWFCGETEMARSQTSDTSRIRVGDVVKFHGQYESRTGGESDDEALFAVRKYEMTKSFRDSNPGETFVSVPPPAREGGGSVSDRTKVCKFWLNSGRCPRESCQFKHEVEDAGNLRRKYVEERLAKRAELQLEHEEGGGGGTGMISRHQRASVFADWLGKEFDTIFSRAETGPEVVGDETACVAREEEKEAIVLDVAGGRGDLAFELNVKRKLTPPVLVVDPRGQKVRRWQAKMIKKSTGEEPAGQLPTHLEALFDENIFEREEIKGKRIALVIGMHPDEATEPLVEVALQFGIAFAVIPCCVFAHRSPDRRLKDGTEPRTYEQFCDYLMEKEADIQKVRLGFRGRDNVLFWKP